ncbi:hypothetical protein ACQPXH_15290 [Nocardia sp. CA-135953]
MFVGPARQQNIPTFLSLAAEVEHWFGPMVEAPGFHEALETASGAARP